MNLFTSINALILLVGLLILVLSLGFSAFRVWRGHQRAGVFSVVIALIACVLLAVGLVRMTFPAQASAAPTSPTVSSNAAGTVPARLQTAIASGRIPAEQQTAIAQGTLPAFGQNGGGGASGNGGGFGNGGGSRNGTRPGAAPAASTPEAGAPTGAAPSGNGGQRRGTAAANIASGTDGTASGTPGAASTSQAGTPQAGGTRFGGSNGNSGAFGAGAAGGSNGSSGSSGSFGGNSGGSGAGATGGGNGSNGGNSRFGNSNSGNGSNGTAATGSAQNSEGATDVLAEKITVVGALVVLVSGLFLYLNERKRTGFEASSSPGLLYLGAGAFALVSVLLIPALPGEFTVARASGQSFIVNQGNPNRILPTRVMLQQAAPSATPQPSATPTELPTLTSVPNISPTPLFTQVAYAHRDVPTSSACTITAQTTLNLRGDPSVQNMAIGRVFAGSLLPVTGRTADKKWWRVINDDGTSKVEGWVSGDYVTLSPACDTAPVIGPTATTAKVPPTPRP